MQAVKALPRSTIVLAVLTCIPFGLAIRDTVTDRYAHAEIDTYRRDSQPHVTNVDSDDEDYRDVARRRALEEIEHRAEMDRLEQEDKRRQETAKATLRTLYDAEVATYGAAFASIKLGEKITERPAPGDGYAAMLIDNGVVAHTLWIELRDRRHCTQLELQLGEAWGPGRYTGDRVWVNERAGQRAVFAKHGDCTLKFEKIAPLASWLDKTPRSIVPLWVVGQPLATLKTALGEKAMEVEGQITWTDYGLGGGTGPTQITAYSENGRVTGLLAAFKTDDVTQDQLIERITQLTGKQPQDDAPVWKSNPPIELQTGAQLFLHVGKQPK